MDDFTVDPDQFVFTYPVFFLLDPKPPVSFVSRDLVGHSGYGIQLFTDEPAVDDYLARNPQPPGVIKHPAQNRRMLIGKLEILTEQNKFTHVIMDDLGNGPGPKRCFAIRDLVEYLKANPE
jgi:hypothetical protein